MIAILTLGILIGGGSPIICYTHAQWIASGHDVRLWPKHHAQLICSTEVCKLDMSKCKTLFIGPASTHYPKPQGE